ncbi:hypothetical protein NHX12_007306, partial [Muraenolepis orangiensis]
LGTPVFCGVLLVFDWTAGCLQEAPLGPPEDTEEEASQQIPSCRNVCLDVVKTSFLQEGRAVCWRGTPERNPGEEPRRGTPETPFNRSLDGARRDPHPVGHLGVRE